MSGGVQKRLNDLRKTRQIVKCEGVDDGEPYAIEVWVVKLNDEDTVACRDVANAAKARTMIGRHDETSDVWLAAYAEACNLDESPQRIPDLTTQLWLAEFLSYHDMVERMQQMTAEVAEAEDSEWAKEDYLQGLMVSWYGSETTTGLQIAYHSKDDDPETLDPAVAGQVDEAVRVFSEIERYETAVAEKIEAERQRFVREHADIDIEDLRRMVVKYMLDERAGLAWVNAYDRARIYYVTRELDDHKKRYFKSPADVADVPKAVRAAILDAYDAMAVEGVEGKGLRGPQSSLPQSGSSGEEETSAASGPTIASG